MPGIRGPLSIRVNDGHTDRIVSRYCSGLKFTKVAPGGHQSLSFTMNLPRNTFNDLGPQDRAYVYDARTARPIIDGYLENPTPVDGPQGQQYDISAVGGMALANDETRAMIYVDKSLSGWQRGSDSAKSANVTTGDLEDASNNPLGYGVLDQFPSGQLAVATDALANVGYFTILQAGSGLEIGGLHVTLVGGKNDANYTEEILSSAGAFAFTALTTTPATADFWVVTNFPSTAGIGIRLRRSGAPTNVADDTSWLTATDLSIIGRRMDRHGILLSGAAGLVSTTEVLASQVVEDLLGRLLTFCDPDIAEVDSTSYGITQLAYPDGAKAAGILDDVAVYEPGLLWEILETLPNGKHRFNFRTWPTTSRYEVSVADGWQQKGSDVDLCNRVLVTWTDPAGNTQVTPVTAQDLGLVGIGLPVDELYAQGRTKDADPVTLPDGHGSLANAQQIGAAVLRDKINPPKAGTVLVRRPIMDHLTGNRVLPHELEPGYLCRVRELGDDLPVTQADYDDENNGPSMLLTLGRPVLTDEQRLARLASASPGIHIST